MNRVIYYLLFGLSFCCLALPLQAAAGELVVRTATADDFSRVGKSVQLLSPTGGGGKFFMDKTEGFIIDLPPAVLPTEAVVIDVKAGGDSIRLNVLKPFYIANLAIGEPEIKMQLRDAQGKALPFLPGAKSTIGLNTISRTPLFKNDAVVLGILILLLGLVFWTETLSAFKGFYRYVPALLLCYFLPSILNSLGVISGAYSDLYFMTSRYLLPASLILLTISIDFKGIISLGPKSIIMFLAATLGIILGGPVALFLTSFFAPDMLGVSADQLWRGLSTIAGSWIGGGANQTAMKEIFKVDDNLFASMIVVDVVVANIWMGFLLYGASISKKMDKWLKADSSAIDDLQQRVEAYQASVAKIPSTTDLFMMLGVAFGGVALSHWGADVISPWMKKHAEFLQAYGLDSLISGFFWLIVIATTLGLLLSFTKARSLEGVGASKWGSVFIYVLVASIGMKMDLGEIYKNLGLFAIGIIWMLVHISILLLTAKIIRAPFFFVAVGSQANVGGAASAPVVASAFSPALAPVGALMAVLGYALGTYGALICALLMRSVAGG
ncbi:MAG: DUF819 family protein [Saprospiraceae bacterium]